MKQKNIDIGLLQRRRKVLFEELKKNEDAGMKIRNQIIEIEDKLHQLEAPMTKSDPKNDTITHCHDGDCPKCGYPETLYIRNKETGDILEEKCSSKKCDWSKKFRTSKKK